MLPITQYPRRFPTANKRSLSLLGARLRSTSTKALGAYVSPTLWSSRSTRPHGARQAALISSRLISEHRFILPLHSRGVQTTSGVAASTSAVSSASKAATAKVQSKAQPYATTAAAVEVEDDCDLYGDRSDEWFTTMTNPRHDPSFPGRCPSTGALSSIAMPNLKTCSRDDMLRYLDNTWALTDALFSTLQGEEAFLTPPPHQLRHPLIFYYGHPTVFYVNKLLVSGLIEKPVNPYFEDVFEVGVDEMRWDDMSKNEMEWPSVSDVTEYRRQVYAIVRDVIEMHAGLAPGHDPIDESNPLWGLCMALEHDRIHLETSSMLMLEHPHRFFKKTSLLPDYHMSVQRTPTKKPVAGKDYPVNCFIEVQGEPVDIGKPRDFPSFGWDNEYGTRTVNVPKCEVSKFMISNGEFYEFVSSGGYLEPKYWSQSGWEWRCFRNTKWPSFWVPDGPSGSHQYKLRAIFDIVPMQWDWPAQVNYHEAQAYCRWKNQRDGNADSVRYHITTEAVHQLLRDPKDRSADPSSDDILTITNKMAQDTGKNLNVSYMSFTPVDAMKPTANGFYDVFGNAWEWCEDMFNPLPGFQVHSYYDDFSAPCFDGEHHIIMGGSFISSGDNGASKFARYHFRPHFFQHAGFRVVAQPINQETNSIQLATTCVNAPGPHAKPAPYRTSEEVQLDGRTNGDSGFGDYQTLFEQIHRHSEQAIEAFIEHVAVAHGTDRRRLLVRGGVSGARKLLEQLHEGDIMIVIHDPTEKVSTGVQIHETLLSLDSTLIPVFKKENDRECRVQVCEVSAWKKLV